MGREPATVSLSPGAPMTELAVDTRGLRKTYRRRGGGSVGVEGLDLRVPVGGVHGFLGPNGSGKTTTIRMLLGLIRRSEEHTSELQSRGHLVCRLLLEKKKR